MSCLSSWIKFFLFSFLFLLFSFFSSLSSLFFSLSFSFHVKLISNTTTPSLSPSPFLLLSVSGGEDTGGYLTLDFSDNPVNFGAETCVYDLKVDIIFDTGLYSYSSGAAEFVFFFFDFF